LSAAPAIGATPSEHNCAGVFASRFASGPTISGLALEFRGVPEFVLPDANRGDQQREASHYPRRAWLSGA
jgi:hypothetical protein